MSATGIDTNVLLRLVLNDDLGQRALALRFGTSLRPDQPGFVNLVVLVELHWALRSRYRQPRAAALGAIRSLLRTRGLVFEGAEAVARALDRAARTGADFADAVIAERNLDLGCFKTVTFDQDAARLIPSMELLS
ncbi:MAG TPA: type II toxin-antitoxin system VapC family toxin [Mesorhizobium sp.]|nr:type II toxin-antitoxin system VapC family toxin [Mesorhizobium sp.]